jgi:hypothetical protein
LYIDGEQIGPVPYEGTVPSGNRRLEVRAPGYDPHVAQVMLTPGAEPRLFDVALIEEGAMSDEERARLERERLENYAGQTSFAANVIPTSQALIDMSVGYPSFFELRASTGFAEWIDGGIAIRGNHRLFEFEARSRVAWRVTPQIGLGAQVFFGGGIGPDSANSLRLGADALASILFAKRAAMTLWVGFDFYRDRYTRNTPTVTDARLTDNTGMVRLGGSFELRPHALLEPVHHVRRQPARNAARHLRWPVPHRERHGRAWQPSVGVHRAPRLHVQVPLSASFRS